MTAHDPPALSAYSLRPNVFRISSPLPTFVAGPPLRPGDALRIALQLAASALACYLAARLGALLPLSPSFASPLWIAPGVALAFMVRGGRWPAAGAWIGFFASYAFERAGAKGIGGFAHALLLSLATVGGLGLAALALRRTGFHLALDRRRDLLRLGLATASGMCVPATAAALSMALRLDGATAPVWPVLATTWLHAWFGGTVSVLIAGVPLLSATYLSTRLAFTGWKWLPTVLLFMATVMCGWLAFQMPASGAGSFTPWAFAPHVLLLWLAARSGVCVASFATLAVSAFAAWSTSRGFGPFGSEGTLQLPLLWGYACSLSGITLLVAALVGEVAANHERWQLALDGSNIGVCDWEPGTGRMIYSRRWLTMLGYTDAEFGQGCEAWLSHIHEDDVGRVRHAVALLLAPGTPTVRLEYRMRCRDGNWKWVETHGIVAEYGPQGQALRIVGAMTDITERRAANERERLAARMFHHLHEGLLLIDSEHRVLDVNPAFSQITGYARDEMLGAVPSLLRPRSRDPVASEQQTQMWASLEATGSWRGEMLDRRRNGDPCALQVTISSVPRAEGGLETDRARDGQPDEGEPYHVLVISDVTQERLQREQLERHSHTDELTLLPNRLRLAQMLEEALVSSRRDGHFITVCYVDLDHFKPVNDEHGHPAGDRLLVEVASRLRMSLRGGDAVARLGGDEFVLLLRSTSLQESQFAVQRLLNLIRQPYAVDGKPPVQLTASVGATVFPLDDADAGTLLRHADHAMYGAKQAGRNGSLFFDAEHNRRTEERYEALTRVEEALAADEFVLYYQPKVDMRRGTVYGVEALLRWRHPELGVLPPAQFLPLIEHTGLSELVGDWVLAHGIAQLAEWRNAGLDISVSVNVSARHLQEPRFAGRLAELLAAHPPALAHGLELEVLETAALADIDFTSALMEQCRTLGVRFALDDFGTGYSNLSYLRRLPVDVLKIDRSFVHTMLDDPQDMAIVLGVIGLSNSFGCMVVAEGVESADQARQLLLAGCEIGQGAGIASPMPAEHILEWVKSYRGAPFEALLEVLEPG